MSRPSNTIVLWTLLISMILQAGIGVRGQWISLCFGCPPIQTLTDDPAETGSLVECCSFPQSHPIRWGPGETSVTAENCDCLNLTLKLAARYLSAPRCPHADEQCCIGAAIDPVVVLPVLAIQCAFAQTQCAPDPLAPPPMTPVQRRTTLLI